MNVFFIKLHEILENKIQTTLFIHGCLIWWVGESRSAWHCSQHRCRAW